MRPAVRSSRRARRCALALLVGAGLPLTIACWSGRAWGSAAASTATQALPTFPLPTPTIPPLPTPTIPPIPTPTLPLPSLTLPPIPTPTLPIPTLPPLFPTPTPTGPGGTPTPGTGPPGSPTPGVPGEPPATTPGGTVPGGYPATPGGPGTPAGLENSNSYVLGELFGLLGTPPSVGLERPSLEHFGVPGSRLASETLPLGGGDDQSGLLWLIGAASLIVAGCLCAAASRRPRLYRAAIVAAIPFAVVAAISAAAHVSSVRAVSVPVAPRAPASVVQAAATQPATPRPALNAVGEQLFAHLVALEGAVTHDEDRIASLTADAEQTPVADPAQSPSLGAGGPGADFLDGERTVAATLEGTLQEEYAFFASTASDPAQATALMDAAAGSSPLVRDVVAYDVQAVQAEAAQQTAISQASQNFASSPAIAGSAGAPGTLQAPLSGVITQGFGPTSLLIEPALTFNGVTYPHFHTGLDIAAPRDTPVHAAADGVVALAGAETDSYGRLVGYGYYVVIAHAGGMLTIYGHLDQVLARPGLPVHAGDVIGLEGSTGNSTGPHVHFEVRVNGMLADPRRFLSI